MNLEQIRENERISHQKIYANMELYEEGSWLSKPVKTIVNLFPHFSGYDEMRVLDLGCGIGRNCIAIAQHFQHIPCTIHCVDILDFAIEKLNENAQKYGVSHNIRGTVMPMKDYPIEESYYDWVIAVSALEHVASKDIFVRKLMEIRNGIRENGIAAFIINSNVREFEKTSGAPMPAQFEVNLPTQELLMLLHTTFTDFTILQETVKQQRYDIPRGSNISDLHTDVVTFVAKNKGG